MQYQLRGDCSLRGYINHKGERGDLDFSLDGIVKVNEYNAMHGRLTATTNNSISYTVDLSGDKFRNGFTFQLINADPDWTDLYIEGVRKPDGAHTLFISPFSNKTLSRVPGLPEWLMLAKATYTQRPSLRENAHFGHMYLTQKQTLLECLKQRTLPYDHDFSDVSFL